MSSEKYATEENIRSLITLIRDELSNYVTKEEFGSGDFGGGSTTPGTTPDLRNYVTKTELSTELSSYVTMDEFNQAIQNLPGGAGLKFETIYSLPDEGEPGTIYLLYTDGEGGTNQYDEYIWDADEERFEQLGPTAGGTDYVTWENLLAMLEGISQGNGLTFEIEDDGELPIGGQSNVIYLVPVEGAEGDEQNKYDEYIWLEEEQRFEKIGTAVNAPQE